MFTPKKSHLLQMRGLKQNDTRKLPKSVQVASFTDAWIETISISTLLAKVSVASFTDAWIETKMTHENC